MDEKNILLIGAPMDCGKRRQGCRLGPDAYRVGGLGEALEDLGHRVEDLGNVWPEAGAGPAGAAGAVRTDGTPERGVFARDEVIAWTRALTGVAREAAEAGLPIFMGGDHAISLGTVSGVAAHARAEGRPLFLLWLDAHADYHSPRSSGSGNLHGTPVGFVTGRDGFDGFPETVKVPPENVALLGLRSVDPAERAEMQKRAFLISDMRRVDERGIAACLQPLLDRVRAVRGLLHVSLDVDFLDPGIAPAVGTTVPGGATFREAHLVMEMLCDSGCVTSLDLVELNPMLDERGRTAQLMVDLVASLMGKRVFDRETPGMSGSPSGAEALRPADPA